MDYHKFDNLIATSDWINFLKITNPINSHTSFSDIMRELYTPVKSADSNTHG